MKRSAYLVFTIVSWVVAVPAWAGFTTVNVSKGSREAKELGIEITAEPNDEKSKLHGSYTFALQAPRKGNLQFLSRVILRIARGHKTTARVPLELNKSRSAEVSCHFQLEPELARHAYLELVCPAEGMPNGVIYRVKVATYLVDEEEQ